MSRGSRACPERLRSEKPNKLTHSFCFNTHDLGDEYKMAKGYYQDFILPQLAHGCRILAIDPSLNSTGICITDGSQYFTGVIVPGVKNSNDNWADKLKDGIRLEFISDSIQELVDALQPDYIVIEGASYGSKQTSASIVSLGEGWGQHRRIISRHCRRKGAKAMIVAPMSLKSLATGKTKGVTKEDMLAAAVELYKVDFSALVMKRGDHSWKDQVDAFLLCKVAEAVLQKQIKRVKFSVAI